MSRQYTYYKRKRRTEGDAAFILIVLLSATAWSHKAAMLQAEHAAMVVGIVVAALCGAVVAFRLTQKLRSWRQVRSPNMAAIDTMTGLEFEKCVEGLLRAQGYTHIRLTEEYDYGVDIIADKDGVRWGIQVKRYSGLVKAAAVRQVVTALKFYNCDRAMVITNSTYSTVARQLADSNECILIDRSELLRLIG